MLRHRELGLALALIPRTHRISFTQRITEIALESNMASLIRKMLEDWEQRSTHVQEQVSTQIVINKQDLIKVEALAQTYKLPAGDLLANIINTALLEIEAQIPYVASDKVARIEDDEPVYADAGHTPEYLTIKTRLENVK